jgi:uncharacterized protein (DUF1697 family)
LVTMKVVAFVRNINVGQKGFPSRPQLEQAFLAAGARSAMSFQSNGTVVAEVEDGMRLELLGDGAGEYLRAECGFGEAIFVRELAAIRAAVGEDPYAGIEDTGYPHRYVSYYDYAGDPAGMFPLASAKGDCLVFAGTGQEAYSVAKEIRGVSGYPTPLLEKRLGVPVTTRSWTTLVRLVGRF